MVEIILSYVETVQRELILFCVVWFIIGGLDDILVDIIWMLRSCYRRLITYKQHVPMDYRALLAAHKTDNIAIKPYSAPHEYHAIFIPAWKESNVIGNMLYGCRNAWANSNIRHHIYVGCYPNDNDTIAQVIIAAKSNPNISLILCSRDGPTTKADCLNHLWKAMVRDELNLGLRARSIILHDAEDRPHPLSLAIFDRLIGRNDIVQLPVIPIAVPGSPLISGHYCDEFCESHGKAMVVREAIGASLPLAGVGCAIERNCLGRLAINKNNLPFDVDSVTEDYELGLNIGSAGRGSIIVRMKDQYGDLIGTRAYFPHTLESAIRQKSRWKLGTALSAWDRLGWSSAKSPQARNYERRSQSPKQRPLQLPYNIGENWMRLRDRKEIFASFVVFLSYVALLLSIIIVGAKYWGWHDIAPLSAAMQTAIMISSSILVWRFIMRTAFLYYHYGFWQSCLALPRMITANIISILAARRAVSAYARYCFGGTIIWEKTDHSDMPAMPQNFANIASTMPNNADMLK